MGEASGLQHPAFRRAGLSNAGQHSTMYVNVFGVVQV